MSATTLVRRIITDSSLSVIEDQLIAARAAVTHFGYMTVTAESTLETAEPFIASPEWSCVQRLSAPIGVPLSLDPW
jgi:hypothetical protein